MTAEEREISALSLADREVYQRSRETGASHKFALMCALQSPPVMRGKYFGPANGSLDVQHKRQKALLHNRTNEAIKRGYRPNQGDVYCPDLANFPGDPAGFVSGGMAEYKKKRVARDDMHLRRLEAEKKANVKLAPDIVEGIARQMIATDPNLKRKPKRELHEEIVHRHGPQD